MQSETLFDEPEPDRNPYTAEDSDYRPPAKRTPTYWRPSGSAVARTHDPIESHAAAKSVTAITEKQRAVYDCLALATDPLSDYGLARFYAANREQYGWPKQSESGLRTRRNELAAQDHIIRSGTTKLPTGRNAATWTINPDRPV